MRRKQSRRSGFALLFVFMLSAAIAVMLYREMPRIVFQGQREKEQLLIDRGEQYKRAIQLYVRKNKKYPASLDDIEKSQDIRFLRKKYKDPLTGKDDWRIIHMDAAGVLTDSLVQKPKDPFAKEGDKDKEKEKELAAALDPNLSGLPVPPGEATAGLARRGSDRPAAIAGQGQPVYYDPNRPYDPNQPVPPPPPQDGALYSQGQPLPGQPFPPQGQPYPGAYPSQPVAFPQGQPNPFPTLPGGFPQGQNNPYATDPLGLTQGKGNPFITQGNFQAGIPGLPGQQPFNPLAQIPGSPAAAVSSQAGGVAGTPFPGMQNRLGAPPIPGAPVGGQAVDLIRQLLTTPRPGGLPGGAAPQQAGMGAGIAGIASKADGKGIKIYAEREKIKEWEFVYDYKQDKSGAAATGQASSMAGFGGKQPAGSQPSSSPFGNSPAQTPSRTR